MAAATICPIRLAPRRSRRPSACRQCRHLFPIYNMYCSSLRAVSLAPSQQMKPAQLGELLNDDAAFKLYLNNIEGVQTMRSLRDELRASQQGDSDTADLDQQIAEAEQQLADNKARLSSKLTQQDKIMSQLQVSNLVEALTDLAHEIEEETDELARKIRERKQFLTLLFSCRRLFRW